MRLRLTPQDESFFRSLTAAAVNCHEAALLLKELLNWGDPALAEQIRDKERTGDAIAHEMMRRLNRAFITPLDREDIHALSVTLDDVVDCIDAAATHALLFGVEFLPPGGNKLLSALVRQAELSAHASPRLRDDRRIKTVTPYVAEIHDLEREADTAYRHLLADLLGGGYDALTVMKVKEVIDRVEDATDAFERVADTVEAIAVKES